MTQKPDLLLSIVVPIYNVSLYLEQCLESVLHQGLDPHQYEVLMVNDGSTDGSDLIAAKWAQRHESFVLINQENAGLSAARNKGLDRASGHYLVFLDSDDIVPEKTYSNMIALLEQSGSDFVTAPAYRFSTWKRHAWPFARNIDLFSKTQTGLNLEQHPSFLRDFTAWNKVYRREFFVKTGVRFPDGRIYEDVATSPKLYHQARAFDVYAEPGYFWRVTPGGITQTVKPAKALDRLWAIRQVQTYLDHAHASEAILEEWGFAVVDYNLRWIFLDFHLFDAETQVNILAETEAIMRHIRTHSVERVDEPVRQWALLAQQGAREELISLLRSPHEIDNASVLHETVQERIIRRIKERRELIWGKIRASAPDTRRRIKHLGVYLIWRPLVHLLPIDKKRVVFSNYWGQKFSLSDGPAALCVELAKRDPSYSLVVFASKGSRTDIRTAVRRLLPNRDVKVVTTHGLRYYYHLWRAKYLFNDVNFAVGFRRVRFVKKRAGQIEVQTTHGIPIKKMGLDSDEAIEPNEIQKFLVKSSRYDYLVSTSPYVAETFSKAHGVAPKILRTGLPQNDQLFEELSDIDRATLQKKYGLDPSKRTVLYAPTFRHGRGFAFRYLIDFHRLQQALGDDHQIIIKMHPFNHTHLAFIDFRHMTDFAHKGNGSPFIRLLGEVRDDPEYIPVSVHADEANSKAIKTDRAGDINELMKLADVLITDYSSLMFGYIHLNKPLIVFTPDAGHYSSTRGLYLDIDEVAPGAVAKNTEQLIDALTAARDLEGWFHTYEGAIDEFKMMFLQWERGHASAKVLEEVGLITPASDSGPVV